ncbi:hypothetical protein RF11_13446 [Thelohanellus kitauei]|uniref:Uncharacterized protein n=1 Tax=Thelohanellus kitauei TaxID=669202 RepID=A0A0C2N7Q5_THEKT|nr:hypothetical protein RF11_13446 [Thelohanellus kitauei]
MIETCPFSCGYCESGSIEFISNRTDQQSPGANQVQVVQSVQILQTSAPPRVVEKQANSESPGVVEYTIHFNPTCLPQLTNILKSGIDSILNNTYENCFARENPLVSIRKNPDENKWEIIEKEGWKDQPAKHKSNLAELVRFK